MSSREARPPAKAVRIDVVRRSEAQRLAPGVAELLLRHAKVMSEGAVRSGIGGRDTYFGSTMLTVDLRDVADSLRLAVDDGLASSLAPLLERSGHMKVHCIRIARSEAERKLEGQCVERFTAELRTRAVATRLEIDVDVEMTLGTAAGRRAS